MFWGLIVVAVVAFIGVLVFKNNPNQAVAKGGAGVSVLVLLAAVVGIAVTEMGSGRSATEVIGASENGQRVLAYGIAEKFKGQNGVVFITGSEDGTVPGLSGDRKIFYDYLVKYGIPETDILVVDGFPANVLASNPKALISMLKSRSNANAVVLFGLVPTAIVKEAVEKNIGKNQDAYWLLTRKDAVPKNVKAVEAKSSFVSFNFSGDDAKDFSELFVIE